MSKSSHLGRPRSGGSKSPSLRKELQGNRSCMLRIGERLMRAGSEGNLVLRPIPAQSQSHASSAESGQRLNEQTSPPALENKATEDTGNNSSKDPGNSLSKVSSYIAVDSSTKHLLQKKQHTNSILLGKPDTSPYGPRPHSPSTLPRSYATSAGASSRESQLDNLMMQHLELERKKEVFLDHLRQKYPHHTAIIMRNQDHIREQRLMDLEADVVHHELIYIKETDFNLAKQGITRMSLDTAIINNPRKHGAIFCVLAFLSADTIKILTQQIRK